MRYYDAIISLGEDCYTSMALRYCHLQDYTLPFDWCRGILPGKSTLGGIPVKVDLICNDFKDYFNIEDFDNQGPNPKEIDYWHLCCVNRKTGLRYRHDFPSDKEFAESFPEIKEKYDRRVERFYNLVTHSDKILFVFMSRTSDYPNEKLVEQCAKLQSKFPAQRIDLLCLIHKQEYRPDQYEETKLNEHVTRIDANITYTKEPGEGARMMGNAKLYRRLLKNYCSPSLFDLRYELAKTHFPNINRSFARHAQNLRIYYVANHLMRGYFKIYHLKLKMLLHTGKKREMYAEKCRAMDELIRQAQEFRKSAFKI